MTKLLDTINLQTQQNNPAAVGAALHSIKGVASTMGAKILAAKASELEKEFKSHGTSAENKVLKQETLRELTNLLELSNVQLQELLGSFKQSAPPAAVTQLLSRAEWQHNLAEILPALEADNMSAVDMLEQLYRKSSPHEQAQLSDLLAQVNDLQYSLAIATINQILAKN